MWGNPDLIALLKEWQPLLGGVLAVLAACIFAAASVSSARIRADGTHRSRNHLVPDLRTTPAFARHDMDDEPYDLVRSLEQLRSLVRSALSALTPSENSTAEPVGATHQSYERILHLPLEKSGLPETAPKAAHDLLESLAQHVDILRLLLDKKASASAISNILIKVNTTARNLLALLASASNTERPPNPPSTLQQR